MKATDCKYCNKTTPADFFAGETVTYADCEILGDMQEVGADCGPGFCSLFNPKIKKAKMQVKIKKLLPCAKAPTFATEGSAGADLYAAETVTVNPGDCILLRTGLAFAIPKGFVGLVFPRSGLSLRTGLRQPNAVGVIDSDYRGEVRGMFENTGYEPVTIDTGDRFAQMVFVACEQAEFVETEALGETSRGAGGFGSTGVKSNE